MHANILSVAILAVVLIPILIWIHMVEVAIVCALLSLLLMSAWSITRFLGLVPISVAIVIFSAAASLMFIFVIKDGIRGPGYILVLVSLVVLMGIVRRKFQWWILLGHILLMMGLLYFDYVHPTEASSYSTIKDLYIDFFITGIFSILVLFFAYRQTINGYQNVVKALREKDEQNQELAKTLEAINFEKDRLFSVLAHDIRSPLASVEGTLELIAHADLNEEEIKSMSSELLSVTRGSMFLVENMLYWSKNEVGDKRLINSDFFLDDLMKQIMEMFQPMAKKKNILLEAEITPGIRLNTHRSAMEVLLRNTIHNAIKFTPNGGRVSVYTKRNDQTCILMIEDDGPGLSPERFELESQNSSIGTAGERGTGLGLVLIKSLAKKLNLKTKVTNPISGGTKFNFDLSEILHP